MKSLFVLYEGRARCGDTDDASVLDTAESEEEVRDQAQFVIDNFPDGVVWYQYDDIDNNLTNERIRLDLSPEMP